MIAWIRITLITVCAFALCLNGLFAQSQPARDDEEQVKTKVKVLQIVPRTLKSYSSYVGDLKPLTKVDISSEIAGVVEYVNAELGQRVEKEDLLVKVDTKKQMLNSQLNRSNYELALKDYEREAKLLKKRLSTPAKVENLKNNLEVSRLRLELSKLDLERSRIQAPISGVISDRQVETGEYIRVGSKLLEILDISKVLGIIHIPERHIRYIHPGKTVTITVDALPGETYTGFIKTIGLQADPQSRSFKIEIEIDNQHKQLRPGMLIRARLLKMSLANQIIIPRHTVQEDEHGSFVYLVKNEEIIKRKITIGISVDGNVQVLSGLNTGDYLVETGQQLVSPQEIVEVIAFKKQT